MPNDIYPGFSGRHAGFTRVQRLEKGSQRYQRGQLRPTAGNFVRLPNTILHTKMNGQQVIDISKVEIRKIGGASIAGNTPGFAYTSTDSSITWYWDGTNGSTVLVITRADNSRFTIPTSGSGLTVTGLSASTDYYFLPFWNINSLCNIGWVQGTVGSPQIAFVIADTVDPTNNPFYLMQQTLQQNEPLSTGYMIGTTASGGSSGSGGAGGGGGAGQGCVMAGTDIVTLGDIPFHVEVMRETEWIHFTIEDGRELYCTYDHPLYHAVTGKTRADGFMEGEKVITDKGEQRIVRLEYHRRVCSKHKVMMDVGHLYWANGFLSHNQKPFYPP